MSDVPFVKAETLAPRSIEAEEAVLGAVLINPSALRDLEWLDAGAFFIVRHRWIMEAARSVAARGDALDYLTIVHELEQGGRLTEVGGSAYVLSLINKTPSSLNVESYAHIVERMAIRRQLLDAAQKVAQAAQSDEMDILEVMRQSTEAVVAVESRIVSGSADVCDVSEVVGDVKRQSDAWRADPADVRGVASGLNTLDTAFGGFEAREITFLAARPGMGKSGMLARIARGAGSVGYSVLLFSLEMTALSMTLRMACQMAGVDSRLIKSGRLPVDGYRRFDDALGQIALMPIREVARGMLPLDDIMAIARAEGRKRKVDLVMIDTLNKIPEAGDTLYQQMSRLTGRLAGWALNSDFHVLVAAQLSRANNQRADKIPQLSDLRDSGTVEQDADNVIFLHRDYYYDQSDQGKRNDARFIIAKRREGKVGSWPLWWTPESTNFEPADVRHIDFDVALPIPATHAAYASKEAGR